jgi:hypothetical protein
VDGVLRYLRVTESGLDAFGLNARSTGLPQEGNRRGRAPEPDEAGEARPSARVDRPLLTLPIDGARQVAIRFNHAGSRYARDGMAPIVEGSSSNAQPLSVTLAGTF